MTPANLQFYKKDTWEKYIQSSADAKNILAQMIIFTTTNEFDHFFYHTAWYEKLSVALCGRSYLNNCEKYIYHSLLREAMAIVSNQLTQLPEGQKYAQILNYHPLFAVAERSNEEREEAEKLLLEALNREKLLAENIPTKDWLKNIYHATDPLDLFLRAGCNSGSFYANLLKAVLSARLAMPTAIAADVEIIITKIMTKYNLENKQLSSGELLRDIAPHNEPKFTLETSETKHETIATPKIAPTAPKNAENWQTRIMPQINSAVNPTTPTDKPDISPDEANEQGIRLFKGDGIAQDQAAAVQMFAQAARGGSPEGQYNLAFCYLGGYGIAKDAANALKWYDQAAQMGYLPAMCRLGEIYEKGHDAINANPKLALHWYERAALEGHSESQFKTAQYYASGQGCTKNYEQAAKYYLLAAQNNHAQAQYNYGVCCYMALGREKDLKESFNWYQKAADNGLAIAQNELGNCYFYASGTAKNDSEAVKWYQKAANADYPPAQCNLAIRYYLGQGVKENNTEAFKWFQKSASHGYAEAENYLGLCYDNGYGTKKDQKSAFSYYSLAAEKKFPDALNNLALCYYYGTGIKKDKNKAKEFFLEAATLGSKDAKDNLKKFYKINQ